MSKKTHEKIFQVVVFNSDGSIYSISECPADCLESKTILMQDAQIALDEFFGSHVEIHNFYRGV